MAIQIVFVTENAEIIRIVQRKKNALLPADVRANGFKVFDGEEIFVSSYSTKGSSGIDRLIAHIEEVVRDGITSVLLISDGSVPDLLPAFGDIFSVNLFEAPKHGVNIHNLVQTLLAKVLKNFRYYRTRFFDLKYQQLFRLPLKNFMADEIGVVRDLCHDMIGSERFGRQLDEALAKLRSRQRPKKASSRPERYFVDDDDRHFQLGAETHAKAETSQPPHTKACVLGNRYRFGIAFNGETHFNVSKDKDESMSGNYVDCHGAFRPGGGGKHINMFSNDFF
ncbi:hypothetical protein [Kaistia nematophila]|uniref:Uncharacterized protein n=1 Tax=Kaistia nematophila TaxID=2994654 RepID=A0A9X3ILA5_9HYPH|nr:hypothetical protein [Kaistia nematophila]MCX5570469.1 hypothetical protein [Kaistia nematophila]